MECVIQTPTPNPKASLEFYKKLGYHILSEASPVLVTDGKAVIEINPDRPARAGFRFYKQDWTKELEALAKYSEVKVINSESVVTDPNGVFIYLNSGTSPLESPINQLSPALPGNFMGISMESLNFEKSMDFWAILGYKVAAGAKDQGWVSLSNESGIGISLLASGMCPHLFFNPSFTYFNGGKNLGVISKIRGAGITITEEITAFNKEGIVDNIIIRDPGGFGFFVFND